MKTKNLNLRPALLVLLAVALLSYACTRVEDNARSGSLLTVSSVDATAGGNNGLTGVPLLSDTCDNPDDQPQDPDVCGVFNDTASITFTNDFLMIGPGAINQSPTFLNDVLVNRYRVDYFRPNGRNTPGVDVPFGIDGTMNARVATSGGTATVGIVIVRHEAKRELPLAELDSGSSEDVLTCNAEMKFYGQDLSGRTVSATGYLEIHFANYGEQ